MYRVDSLLMEPNNGKYRSSIVSQVQNRDTTVSLCQRSEPCRMVVLDLMNGYGIGTEKHMDGQDMMYGTCARTETRCS
jgi:hypothetical protein